jgi:dTDP-4-amino-4,6-dideoxygalactose transaminase
MKQIKFSNIGWQFSQISDKCLPEVTEVLQSGNYVQGKYVERFESEFANFSESRNAVAVNSGTSAIHAALCALGIGPGDEVIVPSHTFIATATAVTMAGATPVMVDVDQNGLMNRESALNSIGPKTKAVIPVHLYGSAVEEELLEDLSKELIVIEDSSQAHGARFKSGKAVGSKSRINCYSLYPGKNLGAAGEAGICTTDDESLAEKLRSFRNWGSKVKYVHTDYGLNYRMDEIQAVVLFWKLLKLTEWTQIRVEIASEYKKFLSDSSIKWVNSEIGTPVYHQFVINCKNRDMMQNRLREKGIETQIHYPIAIHQQSALREKLILRSSLSNTELLVKNILSLPIYPGMDFEDVNFIGETMKKFHD